MIWFWLALGAAFFLATADFLTKRWFSDLPLGQMVLVRLVGLVPVCLLLLFMAPIPPVRPAFYWAAGLALPAEAAALFLYLRASTACQVMVSKKTRAKCSPSFFRLISTGTET